VEPEGSVPMNAEKIFTQVVVVVAAFYVKTRRISCPSHCLSRFPVPCSEFRIFDNKWHRLGHWHHRRDKGPEILRVLQKNRAAQEIPEIPPTELIGLWETNPTNRPQLPRLSILNEVLVLSVATSHYKEPGLSGGGKPMPTK